MDSSNPDKQEELKVKYYYLRNEKNEPRVTRCIVMDKDGNIGIGSAICSHSDYPNKRVGKKIAYNRALYALKEKRNVLPVSRPDADYVLTEVCSDDLDYALSDYITFPEREYKGLYLDNIDRDMYLNPLEKKILNKEI